MRAREAKKTRNRQALLDAAAELIAEGGIASASVSAICARATLSRGMVHLHFENKDALLLEVAKYLNERYFGTIETALTTAPDSAPYRVRAIIEADLGESLLNRHNANIWYAFRGLSQAREDVLAYSDTRDSALRDVLIDAFLDMAPPSQRDPQRARDATHGTLALLEGMWTDYYLHSDAFSRASAVRIVSLFVGSLYPEHGAVFGITAP